jgi:hypothetical protein
MTSLLLVLLAQTRLTLPAADQERRYVLAEWTAPDERDVQLRAADGTVRPTQREGKLVRWLIPRIPAGAAVEWTVEPAGKTDGLTLVDDPGGWISIRAPDREITRYYFGDSAKKFRHPFYYPLVGGGVNVLRGHPIEDRAGEAKDHPHHTGIFHTHDEVNGHDYWSMKHAIVPGGILGRATGPVYARLTVQHAWGEDLDETQDVRVLNAGTDALMEFTITLTAARGPVEIGKTKEGTFALRLTTGLTKAGKVTMVDALGNAGEPKIRAAAAPWVDYAGTVDGKPVGVALMNHPSSFRAPTNWHVRDYGLFSANPYYVTGAHRMAKGDSITLRYRILVHSGDAKAADVAAVYAGYVVPAVAAVKP